MIGFVAAFLLLAASSAQDKCQPCWDGSLPQLDLGVCVCPLPSTTTADEKPLANSNCTTQRRSACDTLAGLWDPIACVCSFDEAPDTKEEQKPFYGLP